MTSLAQGLQVVAIKEKRIASTMRAHVVNDARGARAILCSAAPIRFSQYLRAQLLPLTRGIKRLHCRVALGLLCLRTLSLESFAVIQEAGPVYPVS
jgi:hypothetical protein